MELSKKQWEVFVKRLDAIEQSISDDRKDINNISIDLATVKAQNEKILGMQSRQTQKTTDAVEKAVEESTEPLREAVEELSSKPIKISKDQAENLGMIGKLHKTIRGWK